jgi:(2Fe-2S) ferredoxin
MSARPDDPKPYYTAHVFACVNERPEGHKRGSCKARGAEPLRNYMKARAKELGLADVRINQSGCLDRCELGPVIVIYPEGIWYRAGSTADIDEILETHLRRGERVTRLLLRPEDGPVKGA